MRVGSLVPTARTRLLAKRLIYESYQSTGVDAVLNHLDELEDDQIHALIGVLLTATKQHRKNGRPPLPLQFSETQRRELHRLYANGDRSPEVVAGHREYQRVNQRARRARSPRTKGIAA